MFVNSIFSLNKEFRHLRMIGGGDHGWEVLSGVVILDELAHVTQDISGHAVILTNWFWEEDKEKILSAVFQLAEQGVCAVIVRSLCTTFPPLQNIPTLPFPLPLTLVVGELMTRPDEIAFAISAALRGEEVYCGYICGRMKKELVHVEIYSQGYKALIDILMSYIKRPCYGFWIDSAICESPAEGGEAAHVQALLCAHVERLKLPQSLFALEDEGGRYYYFPIRTASDAVVLLAVDYREGEPTVSDIALARTVTPYIALALMGEIRKNALLSKWSADFFDSLLSGERYETSPSLVTGAQALGFDFFSPCLLWIVRAPKHCHQEIVAAIKNHLLSQRLKAFHTLRENDLVFILPTARFSSLALAKPLLEELSERLEERLPEEEIKLSVSFLTQDMSELQAAFESARFLLKFYPDTAQHSLRYYEDFLLCHLIYSIRATPSMRRVYQDTVQKLVDFDRENSSDMVEMLMGLSKFSFNISDFSDSMYYHRNTIYKRIKKIGSILNMDVSAPENKLMLQIALTLHHLKMADSGEGER